MACSLLPAPPTPPPFPHLNPSVCAVLPFPPTQNQGLLQPLDLRRDGAVGVQQLRWVEAGVLGFVCACERAYGWYKLPAGCAASAPLPSQHALRKVYELALLA